MAVPMWTGVDLVPLDSAPGVSAALAAAGAVILAGMLSVAAGHGISPNRAWGPAFALLGMVCGFAVFRTWSTGPLDGAPVSTDLTTHLSVIAGQSLRP